MNKNIYNKPVVEITAVRVEKGFAATGSDWNLGSVTDNELE